MRKPIIAANWKMNKTAPEVETFIEKINGNLPSPEIVEAVIGAQNIFIRDLADQTVNMDVKIAAQNCYYEDFGAFTGETSPTALADLGADYVIIGHSERRQIFGETDELINKKVKAVFRNRMLPIICVGETLEQKEAGETNAHVSSQVKAALAGLTENYVRETVFAYEPIWAIGTGKTATAEDANDTIGVIRETIAEMFGNGAAEAVRIQYGGSVKPENIGELMAQTQIDGALVGGASMEAESYLKLLEAIN